MFFWLLAYIYVRDALIEALPWCTAATYLLVGFYAIRAIIRDASSPPRSSEEEETHLSAERLIAQICHPFAFADLYERGGGWTRAEYLAWQAAQTDSWLIVSNHEEVSASEEIIEDPTQTFD